MASAKRRTRYPCCHSDLFSKRCAFVVPAVQGKLREVNFVFQEALCIAHSVSLWTPKSLIPAW